MTSPIKRWPSARVRGHPKVGQFRVAIDTWGGGCARSSSPASGTAWCAWVTIAGSSTGTSNRRAAIDDRGRRPYDPRAPPPKRRLRRVEPEPGDFFSPSVLIERLDATVGTTLNRLVLREGETYEVNYGEPVDVVIHDEKGACNVVAFGAGNCDIAAGETVRGSADTLCFQQTGDELVLQLLAHH